MTAFVTIFTQSHVRSFKSTAPDQDHPLRAYRNSQAFKDLDPQRNKAIKIIRQYTVEVEH